MERFIQNAPQNIKDAFIYRKYPKGSIIIYPEEENCYLYIIVSGSANVVAHNAAGGGLTLYSYNANSCFGELELFHPEAKTAAVVSSTDCELILLHKNFVYEWLKADFQFTLQMMEYLSEKILVNARKLAAISLLNVKERLIYYVYSHYKFGDLPKITKEQACADTFIPLRSLNRAIAECRAEGYLEYVKCRFYVLSLEKLEECCNGFL
ncbi:Crp/Fnr family transcriptional regulator [Anaerotignum sp.]|uniref:Crp/Fnr family transcriptional regulator n=1 Tax=Anaerotignum sp. TaxID=2039241 RepID=UPI0028AF5B7B|nr:Crp/Fnr family transcriptional regulator [Anaerotignum sp.]